MKLKKAATTTVIITLLFIATHAQNVEWKASNFKDDKDAYKEAFSKFKEANDILVLGNEAIALVKSPEDNFKKALQLYQEVYAFNPSNAELNMNLANCYLYTTSKEKAIPHIEKAFELDKNIDPFLYFLMGQAEQLQHNYDKAIEHYSHFEKNAKSKYVAEYKKIISKYKKECKYGQELIADKKRVWVDNLEHINSSADDYSPCISSDGDMLLFTSTRKNAHQPNELGEYDADIYSCAWDGKNWASPKNIGNPLNTENDETASALSYDGQRLLLFKSVDGNADVFESVLNGLDWTAPKSKMSKVVNTDYANETYACYEPLDIKVYYITDKTSKNDVFVSGLMKYTGRNEGKENVWGRGQSVGPQISSKFHEGSLYVHPDGRTMYFSSQGHHSMGGYDIFMSRKNDLEQWSEPVSLGYPINTAYDEHFFAVTANGKYAYIASNRPGGKGGMDLYRVTFLGPEKPVIIDTEDYLIASIAEPTKDDYIEKAVEVEKKSLTVFKGRVLDAISQKPVTADLEITDNTKGEIISSFTSNSATGKFLLSLPSGKNYGIAVKADGYLFHSENFNLPKEGDFNMVNKDLDLKNIKVGSKIALRNVFFATGKADVTSDSYSELDRLVQLMNDVPSLKVEISGHTDNIGSEETNNKLSDERAKAVVSYLIKKGINKSRLTAKGYGSSIPMATNNTEDGRQLNRRTEFEITAN